MISREALLTRAAELERGKAEALAQANAFAGAIQDCEYWLAKLDEKVENPATEESGEGFTAPGNFRLVDGG